MKEPNLDTRPPEDDGHRAHPEHAPNPEERNLEALDRQGYVAMPQREEEFRVWENAAVWPDP